MLRTGKRSLVHWYLMQYTWGLNTICLRNCFLWRTRQFPCTIVTCLTCKWVGMTMEKNPSFKMSGFIAPAFIAAGLDTTSIKAFIILLALSQGPCGHCLWHLSSIGTASMLVLMYLVLEASPYDDTHKIWFHLFNCWIISEMRSVPTFSSWA